MKNKVLKELMEWIDDTPSITRKILKEKINELDLKSKIKKTNNTSVLRFTPPSIDEVKHYCLDRNNNINPEEFIDFYTSKNWMIGKNKMVDWKASVRTWERKNKTISEEKNTTKYGRMDQQQALGTFVASNNVTIPGL